MAKNPSKAIALYNVILKKDKECPTETIQTYLKDVFRWNQEDIVKVTQGLNKHGTYILEQARGEKVDMRRDQLKRWKESGNANIPITYVEVT